MKKNFKKSKFVILPALATLVLTGVASVTGTVAWFTANRTATISGSNFQAKAEGGSLMITYTPGVGILPDANASTAKDSQSFSIDGYLTHGSYDAEANAGGNLYTATTDEEIVTGYRSLGTEGDAREQTEQTGQTSKWKAGTTSDNQKLWYGVSWKMTFTTTLPDTNSKVAVLFDPSTSSLSNATQVNAGFRIAMIAGNQVIVFGNDDHYTHVSQERSLANYTQASGTIDASTKYYTKAPEGETYTLVTNPTQENISSYFTVSYNMTGLTNDYSTKDTYIQNGVSYSRLEDGDSKLANSKEYLGTINSTKDSVEVTCVAWYEGTDKNVTIGNINETEITAKLGFYARTQADK